MGNENFDYGVCTESSCCFTGGSNKHFKCLKFLYLEDCFFERDSVLDYVKPQFLFILYE